MSKQDDKTGQADKPAGASWGGAAAIAGAAIGSAAVAAALLYASRRKEGHRKPTAPPHRPEDAPETD